MLMVKCGHAPNEVFIKVFLQKLYSEVAEKKVVESYFYTMDDEKVLKVNLP